jgi:hypothetical protein
MKVSGVDSLSRGDLTEGMMAGRDPLSFIPFNQGADERSGGRVSRWVRSWWKSRKGADFCGMPLKTITKDNMFELRDLQAARLWMLPPVAMEVVMELLCKDRLAHPQWPHVFVVPRLMTHFWRKDLMKNADIVPCSGRGSVLDRRSVRASNRRDHPPSLSQYPVTQDRG